VTSGRPGWLAYWRLPRPDRRIVRTIETSCRGVGDPRLDGIALARLRLATRRERLLGPLAPRPAGRLPAAVRLARLCSTMRHPSRTGVCSGWPASGARTRPRTS
jgi:hypothetical protein